MLTISIPDVRNADSPRRPRASTRHQLFLASFRTPYMSLSRTTNIERHRILLKFLTNCPHQAPLTNIRTPPSKHSHTDISPASGAPPLTILACPAPPGTALPTPRIHTTRSGDCDGRRRPTPRNDPTRRVSVVQSVAAPAPATPTYTRHRHFLRAKAPISALARFRFRFRRHCAEGERVAAGRAQRPRKRCNSVRGSKSCSNLALSYPAHCPKTHHMQRVYTLHITSWPSAAVPFASRAKRDADHRRNVTKLKQATSCAARRLESMRVCAAECR
jgi:hypothetical protein